ncbi:MAG TPA: AAA family ATPase [Candidatus Margulisbacteria bacterium]|nr:AAA family ATPase [Candidatus Margulisiibacteriota bacterium]
MAKAVYTEQILDEYRNNPLIEALPPIYSLEEVIEKLTVDPGYNEQERQLDTKYRYHCIQRLFKFFQPLSTHIDIEQRVSRAIRQGYLSRNPLAREYVEQLRSGHEMIKQGRLNFDGNYTARATASGFTIIGISGVGKTTAVERILSLYPQVITHAKYNDRNLTLYQIAWMKLDCPYDGSLKGLCFSFFHELDRLMGTAYYKKFATGRGTVDTMLPRMAQMASLHCLGVLVIDEIQHLSLAKSGGSDLMLNFFVTLVNTIGVPVILIGTTKAMHILQGEFRQARRGSGQGDLIWDRLKNDRSFNIMMKAMWKNQWTKQNNPLTEEIINTIYDESQGIIDIAVKLYAMAQMKAIASGTENITPDTIKKVAEEKLKLVRPMLQALRSGNLKEIAKYSDIQIIDMNDFKYAYTEQINKITDNSEGELRSNQKLEKYIDVVGQVVLKLLELSVDASTARKAAEIALETKDSKTNSIPVIVKEAFKIALELENERVEDKKQDNVVQFHDKGDLRHIVDDGTQDGQSAYEALKMGANIKNPEEFGS